GNAGWRQEEPRWLGEGFEYSVNLALRYTRERAFPHRDECPQQPTRRRRPFWNSFVHMSAPRRGVISSAREGEFENNGHELHSLRYGLFQVSSVTVGSANCGLHFLIRSPTTSAKSVAGGNVYP